MAIEDATREEVMELFGEDTPEEILDDYPKETPGAETPGDESGDPEPKPTDDPEPEPKKDEGEEGDDTTKVDGEDPGDEEKGDILSKSGKYTIPYEKLIEARDSAKSSKESEDAALAEVQRLNAEIENLKKGDDGKPEAQKEEGYETADLDELEEEFPGVAKTIKGLQDQIETLTKTTAATSAKTEADSSIDHFTEIESAHSDSQEILTSREFENWMGTQPNIMKNAYEAVYQKGTAEEVIEMLNAFKESTKPEASAEDQDDKAGKDDEKADVAAKIKAAQDKKSTPESLSDVPGVPRATDPAEMLQATSNSGKAVDELFAGKTPEQIDALVNKLL